jgi:hypothetical protein
MNRRSFLVTAAGALAAAAQSITEWKKLPGIELYTVRDLLTKDFEGTIAKVAEIGYRELEPKQFRALLDRHGLRAPSTHADATEDPDLERQLEGHRIMGFRYTEIRAARGSAAQRPRRRKSP